MVRIRESDTRYTSILHSYMMGRFAGCTHGICVILKSSDDLETYSKHPAHQRVVNDFLAPIRKDIMAMDYVV
jgi:hypothetical protein